MQSRGWGGGGGRGRGGSGGRGGKPMGRGGARGGARGGLKVIIEPHKHEGIFIAKGKESMLVTKNLVPGESVYGEKRISINVGGEDGAKVEYRVWNPFRSKLSVGMLGGMDKIFIGPGCTSAWRAGRVPAMFQISWAPHVFLWTVALLLSTDASLPSILHRGTSYILLNFLPGRSMT